MTFVFEPFELDPERLELRSGGERVRIEPRVLEALIYLVRHRDRVVSKDELAREVWGVAHITDAALARAVREARKALGDDGSGRKWIETVYGRGYRFIAPMTESPSIPVVPVPPPPTLPKRAQWTLPLLALLLVASAAAILGMALRRPPLLPPPEGSSRLRIALVPITPQGADLELHFAALSLSDLLRLRLEAVPAIDLRPQPNDGGLNVPAIARRARADYVLSGRLVPSESTDSGTLTVLLHQFPPAGAAREIVLETQEIPYLDEAADLSGLIAIRDALIQRLSSALAQRVDLSSSFKSEPGSLEGYRLYLEATSRLGELRCPSGPQLTAARRALELDPGYAPAWFLYAKSHYHLVARCGGGEEGYRQALRAINRAISLEPRWWEPREIKAVLLLETGRIEETHQMLLRLAEPFPNDPRRKLRLAQALHYAGFLEESRRQLEGVLRAEPSLAGVWDLVPYPYLYAREWDRFLELTPQEGGPIYLYYRGFAELMRGDRLEAQRLLTTAAAADPNDHFTRLSQALLAIVRDDHEEARGILQDLARDRNAAGASDGEFKFKIGELLILAGDPDAGLPILEQAVQQGFFCVPWIENDPALEVVRGTADFQRIVDLARQRHLGFGRRFGLI